MSKTTMIWEVEKMADQSTEGLLSPFLRRKRFDAVKPYLMGRILDYGCGSGALAGLIPAESYLGVDVDKLSLQLASTRFPTHHFVPALPQQYEKFDTVVALAVIEHISGPAEFLRELANHLNDYPTSRVVITSPNPFIGWIHDIGACLGLFSKQANEEHVGLLGRTSLNLAGNGAGLKLVAYSRFLFGANQIAVYAKSFQ